MSSLSLADSLCFCFLCYHFVFNCLILNYISFFQLPFRFLFPRAMIWMFAFPIYPHTQIHKLNLSPKLMVFIHLFLFLFILIFLLLFNYNCLHFLPIPPLPKWWYLKMGFGEVTSAKVKTSWMGLVLLQRLWKLPCLFLI